MLKKFFTLLCLCVLCIGSAWGEAQPTAEAINGKSYIIAAYDNSSSKYYALPLITNATTYSGTEVTVNNNGKVAEEDGLPIWTLTENTSSSGQYYISYKNTSTYYLYKNGTSASNYNIKGGTSDKNYWSFTKTSDNKAYNIVAVDRGSNHTYLNYYSGKFQVRGTSASTTSNNNTSIILLEIEEKSLTEISIFGTPTKTSYFIGDKFAPLGLTVTGSYDDGTTGDVTSEVEWLFDPETFEEAGANVSVDVLASVGSVTSDIYTVSGLKVNAYPNTQETAYTVTEAKALIDKNPSTLASTDVYVKGTISKVQEYNPTYNSITYWLDDNAFEVYSGKGLGNTDFSSIDDVEVGAEVIVCGKIKKYSSTYELDKNNYLVSYKAPTKYSVNIDEKIINGTITATPPTALKGTEVTLTVEPNDGYKLASLTVKDADENNVPVTDNKFIMPESNVFVSAEFELIPTYSAKFFANGKQFGKTQTLAEGESVIFPASNPADIDSKKFVGWTKDENYISAIIAPKFETNAKMGTEALNFYAVYADAVELPETWTKATTITEGTYVMVSEKTTGTYRYMPNTTSSGSNPSLGSGITIANDALSNEVTDEMQWSLISTGTDNQYYIRPNGNSTIGLGTTNSTGTNIRISSSYVNTKWTITANDSYNWQIKNDNSTPMYLAVYADDNWRNYSSSTTNQNGKFYFFKKNGGTTYSNYCTKVLRTFTVSVSPSAVTGLTTLYLDYATEIPENAEAWYVSAYDKDADRLTMTQINDYVPANTAIIVKGTAGDSYDFVETSEDVVGVTGNLLSGSVTDYAADTYTTDDGWYYLATSGNFKKYEGENIVRKAHKAYLQLTDRPWSVSAKELSIDWEPTGIKDVQGSKMNVQGSAYNLNGVRVNENYKGIVIMNGKKYINK